VRLQRGGFLAWLAGVALFAVVLGVVADCVASAISESLREQIAKLGTSAADTPAGFLGFVFEFFVLAVALFACFEVVAVREGEASQQLETLFAQPVGRERWLAARLGLVAAACAVLGLAAGALSWLAAMSQGADLSFGRMLEAGANCLPVALLFLALGALGFAAVPRATAVIAYGLVAVTFLWENVGALAGIPVWALGLSPFHHVGLVPAEPFDAPGAVVMLAVAAVAAGAALGLFGRRDLTAA
jgi:ABC-2 type transport system permease protein